MILKILKILNDSYDSQRFLWFLQIHKIVRILEIIGFINIPARNPQTNTNISIQPLQELCLAPGAPRASRCALLHGRQVQRTMRRQSPMLCWHAGSCRADPGWNIYKCFIVSWIPANIVSSLKQDQIEPTEALETTARGHSLRLGFLGIPDNS